MTAAKKRKGFQEFCWLQTTDLLQEKLHMNPHTADDLLRTRTTVTQRTGSRFSSKMMQCTLHLQIQPGQHSVQNFPQPPFKIECANAQLEQPIATADIQFNIGTYTFTDTFVILSKTSFPKIGLNFMRNHQAVLETANGTINFPHAEMSLAMTDKMKNCNPKPLQIMVEGNQTLPPQQTTTVSAIVITTNTNDVTGLVQPLPQFDETVTIIVAPALATAHNKRINIQIANLTDFPHTIKSHTKLAELQTVKPEETKQIRPLDAAALKLLQTLMIPTCT